MEQKRKYPKNRTDLILSETISEDIKILKRIQDKYRGLEEIESFRKHMKEIIYILSKVDE